MCETIYPAEECEWSEEKDNTINSQPGGFFKPLIREIEQPEDGRIDLESRTNCNNDEGKFLSYGRLLLSELKCDQKECHDDHC